MGGEETVSRGQIVEAVAAQGVRSRVERMAGGHPEQKRHGAVKLGSRLVTGGAGEVKEESDAGG